MLNLKELANKIESLEEEIEDCDNLLSIEFYSDGSGSIHSSSYFYFDFSHPKDLKDFMNLSNEYLIKYRRKY